jgi:diguanylate cyclase (GGDEF)-like protein
MSTTTLNPHDEAPSEAARLRDVYALRLLDTQREERFDRYSELMADLFDVPIAFISLISRNRQWFKATHGTDMRQLDRKESFCSHTISNDEPLVVENLSQDRRFADNPLVRGGPRLQFYAGVPIHGPSGHPVGTVGLLDFSPRKLDQRQRRHLECISALVDQELLHGHQVDDLRQELQRTAYYDPITGLFNQRLLIDRLEFVVQLAMQQRERVFYALLDLQNFGAINQAHGWQTGNELLRAVGRRLASSFADSHVVARWHGDQFVVLFPMPKSAADPAQFAADVAQCFDRAFAVRGQEFYLSVRTGVSVAPDHGTDALALIRSAHAAMRAADHDGRSSYRVYSPRLEQVAVRLQGIAERLRAGLQREEVRLAYQPLLDLQCQRYCGAEALLRWDDTELGYVPPEELIAIAQRAGLQEELELAILRRACTDAVGWEAKGCDMPVAVNLTAIQFHKEDLVAYVMTALEETGLPAHRLILEVTEQSMVVDLESAIISMQALSDVGVRFAVDDFGTGYSSLAYLVDLPVDVVKLDRQFVSGLGRRVGRGAGRGDSSARLVIGIIQMAHSLGIKVLAEGVESEDQLDFLRSADCDKVQGFLVSRPVPTDKLPPVTDRLH